MDSRVSSKKRFIRILAGGFLLILLFCVLIFGEGTYKSNAQERTIKVGYTGTGGIIRSRSGVYSGYTVDYLEEIAEHTGWKYEYVYADWDECIDMLASGEIDLMGMMGITDERSERLQFSELPMSYDYTVLCAKKDSNVYFQDYDAVNGKKIGVVNNSVFEKSFIKRAREVGIDYEIVHFPSMDTLKNALNSGDVDFIAEDSLSLSSDVALVDRFVMTTTYFATSKHNNELMAELNSAMHQVKINDGELEVRLREKYYTTDSYQNFTKEEMEFINNSGPVVIKGYRGRRPLGYEENNQYMGAFTDTINYLGKLCGLEFVFEVGENIPVTEHFQRMNDENYAFIYVDTMVEDQKQYNVVSTKSFLSTEIVFLQNKNDYETTMRNDYVFALMPEMSYLEPLLNRDVPEGEVRYYDTANECMDAVIEGKANITILDDYVANYFLHKPKYQDNLVEIAGDRILDNFVLYVPENQKLLASILNKALSTLSNEQRLSVISNSLVSHPYRFGFDDFVYRYWMWIGLSGVLVVAVFILLFTVWDRIKKLREEKKQKEEMQYIVQRDELTGVYNRKYFFIHSEKMLEQATEPMYMVRVNIQNFKVINELYGTEKGDELLVNVANHFKEMGGRYDFITGRFAADQFYLCMKKSVFEIIDKPRQIHNIFQDAEIFLSYGVYNVVQKDLPISLICDRANIANSTRSANTTEYIHYFSDDAHEKLLYEAQIESEMQRAIDEKHFCIYIQPKYNVDTEEIVGGEALVRWMHPEQGMIPPYKFIELFEKNGFIKTLDYYVWEEVCRFISEEKKKGIDPLPISVNVSRIHFYGNGLINKLTGLIDKYGLSCDDIELEITETVCGVDPDTIIGKINELRDAGFKVAMDDFGSGYSSLNMLKEIPFDTIKMDLKFLEGKDESGKGKSILKTLVDLAKTLNFKVVVEGLETEEQKLFLKTIKNCHAQGYYYSKPVDCDSYRKMLINS